MRSKSFGLAADVRRGVRGRPSRANSGAGAPRYFARDVGNLLDVSRCRRYLTPGPNPKILLLDKFIELWRHARCPPNVPRIDAMLNVGSEDVWNRKVMNPAVLAGFLLESGRLIRVEVNVKLETRTAKRSGNPSIMERQNRYTLAGVVGERCQQLALLWSGGKVVASFNSLP